MRQHVSTMFISNNGPSFLFWWKENLVKHQVSKNYETDCLQNVLLIFMFLLMTNFVKNSHNQAKIFFIYLKSALNQIWDALNQNSTSVKRSEMQLPSKGSFCPVFQLNYSNFRLKTMSKVLDLSKLLKKVRLEESRTSYNQKRVSTDNQLQKIWDWL